MAMPGPSAPRPHGSSSTAGASASVLAEAVGAAYAGVLVSDFYAVYTGYDGRHQYCWAHLLRDVDELVAQHPDDAALRGWAMASMPSTRAPRAAPSPPTRGAPAAAAGV